MNRFWRYLPLIVLWLLSAPLHAALTIEIFGGGATQIPIAIAPFAAEDKIKPGIVSPIVAADLNRSGLFRLVDTAGGLIPFENKPVAATVWTEWAGRGADALVTGSMAVLPDGRVEIRARLFDIVKKTQLAEFAEIVAVPELRAAAHRIADMIYEKLTGTPGVFGTRIVYVIKQGSRYALQVADADGFGARNIVESAEPIISPTWSADGNQIAYVSFENKKPVVYAQTLSSGTRKLLAGFKGSNSAPSFSPDGQKLAVVLTKEGGSQIFLMNADGSNLKRFTKSFGIDTEPDFSPDGKWIIFTSDRGGSPQIYRMAADSANPASAERLTFEGSYNVSPHYSPDGASFVFIQRNEGKFNVAVQDFATRQVQVLTDTLLDESPSFSPNGRTILYATEVAGRGILAAVSSDGKVKQRYSAQAGDVREPAWGPLPVLSTTAAPAPR